MVSGPQRQAQTAAAREARETQLDDNFTNPGPAWTLPEGANEAERHIALQTHAVSDVDKGLLQDF